MTFIAYLGLALVACGLLAILAQVLWYRWEQHESKQAIARELAEHRKWQALVTLSSTPPRAAGLAMDRKAIS